MSEALGAVIDFLFDEVGVNRVESRHDPRNPNSGAVMKKCGMKFEGTLRQSDRNNQGIIASASLTVKRRKISLLVSIYTVPLCSMFPPFA